MKLIITRHGETTDNINDLVSGHLQGKLTENGIRQAKLLAKRLEKEKIDFIYCSDLQRTKDTVFEILKSHKVPVIYDPLLREKTQGIYDGKSNQEYQSHRDKSRHIARWRPEKGENFYDVKNRAKKFVDKLFLNHKSSDTILVVSHSGWITILFSYLLDIPRLKAFRLKFDNATVSEVELKDDQKHKIRLINCAKHLN
jgi:broad specificity phosphatase PhoE